MKRIFGRTRQSNSASALFRWVAAIGGVLTLATALAGQGQQAPTLRIVSEDGNRLPSEARDKLPVIVISGNDMRKLPSGENQIVQEAGNTNAEGAFNATSKFSIQNTDSGVATIPLTKSGPGTLSLPPANAAGAKQGTGTLVLTSLNQVIYEFRHFSEADFERVFIVTRNGRVVLSEVRKGFRCPQTQTSAPCLGVIRN